MLKIRRPLGRLIFNMGIAIPGKTVFLIETAPSTLAMELLQYGTKALTLFAKYFIVNAKLQVVGNDV